MSIALQKAIVIAVLILLGILLKKKITTNETNGIKALILTLALPATVFIALLKVEVDGNFLLLPLVALFFNVALWYVTKLFIKANGLEASSAKGRTMQLLIPSFAPGLSTFAIIAEFSGDKTLALAAFADVGNKVFVLILLYMIAMRWYYQQVTKDNVDAINQNERLKKLLLGLIKEPINIAMIVAVTMVSIGLKLDSLPLFVTDSIEKLSVIMTPIVLIFIGLSVKLRKDDFIFLAQALLWRSGFSFLLSSLTLSFLPVGIPSYIIILLVVLPQSACSFWPFAHMSAITTLQQKSSGRSLFKLDFAVNLLALSLPFSTLLSLAIFTNESYFTNRYGLLGFGILFVFISLVPNLIRSMNYFKKLGHVFKSNEFSAD